MADDLPCADFGLLGPLKRSVEYASIRKRVADPKPADAWRMDSNHYFTFELRPKEDAAPGDPAPYALFVMQWEVDDPIAAMVITPTHHEQQAEVLDLITGTAGTKSTART